MKTFKFNWGTGIFVLYTSFALMIIVLVVMSSSKNIELVTDKYYSEELQFQSKINKQNNAKALKIPLTWKITDLELAIQFPASFDDNLLAGTIKLYCPSDQKKDRQFSIKSTDNRQHIPLNAIPNGRYLLQIDWKNGAENYWDEGALVINN